MTKDEKAGHKAVKRYLDAVDEYGLDNIEDGWGQDRKRYMYDAFFAGFYAGRDYVKEAFFVGDAFGSVKLYNNTFIDLRKERYFKMITYKEKIEKVQVVDTVTCDICEEKYYYGRTADEMEIQEFIFIREVGGFESIFGDGENIDYDTCQRCFFAWVTKIGDKK